MKQIMISDYVIIAYEYLFVNSLFRKKCKKSIFFFLWDNDGKQNKYCYVIQSYANGCNMSKKMYFNEKKRLSCCSTHLKSVDQVPSNMVK